MHCIDISLLDSLLETLESYYRMLPPAIDIIPTSLAVAYSIGKYTSRNRWITSLTIFTQLFIQAQIKENIKAPRHWPFAGNSPVTGNLSHCAYYDVIVNLTAVLKVLNFF